MATKRVKPKAYQIKNLDDANKALADIAKLMIQMEAIDGESSTEIGKIKERAAKAGKPMRLKIEALGNSLATYGEYNKVELFTDKRSIDVSYGTFGFRKSTKVKTKKTTLELLKNLFKGKGVRTKETIDKDVLGEWEDSDLAQIDAAKVQEDNFFYEVNKDEVNKQLLQAAS